jgi:hypothetical protein
VKLGIGSGVVMLIFGFLQVVHLPFVAVASLTGFGYIKGADLTLSETRCAIVKQQLSAVGMPNRLRCNGDQLTSNATSLQKELIETPGVLKNVMILSRVGSEYFIEISKGPHYPKSSKDTSNTTPPSLGKEQETKDMKVKKETVVHLMIPKSDAAELVTLTRILSTGEAEKYWQNRP